MNSSWKNISIGLALAIFVVAVFFLTKHLPSPAPAISNSAAVVGSTVTETPNTAVSTSTPTPLATSTPLKTLPKTKAVPTPTQPVVSESTLTAQKLSSSGSHLLKSLVNIVCVSSVKGVPSVSGTGVVIDSRGIILTAAHVAQVFLLQDYLGSDKVQCLIRTGSPARRAYYAEPIYVSSSWLAANPTTLTTVAPTGNGKNDIALLVVTSTATSTPLPSSLSAIPLGPSGPSAGEQVAIGSYGAQYLSGTQLNLSLYPILVFGSIANRYTYDKGSVDLFSIMGSAASQEGSSGGGVANPDGQIIGIITTSSTEGSVESRTLNAVSVGHIRATYQADTGNNLDTTLSSQSLSSLINGFKSKSLSLGQELYRNIQNNAR